MHFCRLSLQGIQWPSADSLQLTAEERILFSRQHLVFDNCSNPFFNSSSQCRVLRRFYADAFFSVSPLYEAFCGTSCHFPYLCYRLPYISMLLLHLANPKRMNTCEYMHLSHYYLFLFSIIFIIVFNLFLFTLFPFLP